jgi:hypothetical protein
MVEKVLVETKGNFMLMDVITGAEIEAHRPCVVVRSSFIAARSAIGQIKVLAELKVEATDAELVKYINESEGDMELAIESFKSQFELGNKLTSKKSKPVE